MKCGVTTIKQVLLACNCFRLSGSMQLSTITKDGSRKYAVVIAKHSVEIKNMWFDQTTVLIIVSSICEVQIELNISVAVISVNRSEKEE